MIGRIRKKRTAEDSVMASGSADTALSGQVIEEVPVSELTGPEDSEGENGTADATDVKAGDVNGGTEPEVNDD